MRRTGKALDSPATAIRSEHVVMLCEEEWRRPLVIAHLPYVLEIIAPDAPDAANRKGFGLAGDRDRGLRGGRNDEGCRAHEKVSVGLGRGIGGLALRGCADRRQRRRPGIAVLQAEERRIAPVAAQEIVMPPAVDDLPAPDPQEGVG